MIEFADSFTARCAMHLEQNAANVILLLTQKHWVLRRARWCHSKSSVRPSGCL